MSVTKRTALILAGLAIAVVAFYLAIVLIPRDGDRPPDGETIINTTTTITPPSTSP